MIAVEEEEAEEGVEVEAEATATGCTRPGPTAHIITLTDGQKVEYHPSFNFPPHIFHKMKKADEDRLTRERMEYRNKHKANEMSTSNHTQPLTHVNLDNTTQVSQLSQSQAVTSVNQVDTEDGRTIMGGRNERHNTRS